MPPTFTVSSAMLDSYKGQAGDAMCKLTHCGAARQHHEWGSEVDTEIIYFTPPVKLRWMSTGHRLFAVRRRVMKVLADPMLLRTLASFPKNARSKHLSVVRAAP